MISLTDYAGISTHSNALLAWSIRDQAGDARAAVMALSPFWASAHAARAATRARVLLDRAEGGDGEAGRLVLGLMGDATEEAGGAS